MTLRAQFAMAAFAVALWAPGLTLAYAGIGVVRKGAYTKQWSEESSVSIGPLEFGPGRVIHVEQLQGRNARQFGCGMLGFGVALCLWAIVATWRALSGINSDDRHGPLYFAFGLLSLAGLLMGAASFYPPWMIAQGAGPAFFWGLPVGAVAWLALCRTLHLTLLLWGKTSLAAIVLTAIVAGELGKSSVTSALILGFWVWIAVAVNVFARTVAWRSTALRRHSLESV